MKTTSNFGLIITYTDGSHDQFAFPSQTSPSELASLLEKLLGGSVLCLQLEDRLLSIPICNVRSAELFPAPKNLPDTVLRNVERLAAVT